MMPRKQYTGVCPRCKESKIYQATEGHDTSFGIKGVAWWRCDGCGFTYQKEPNQIARLKQKVKGEEVGG